MFGKDRELLQWLSTGLSPPHPSGLSKGPLSRRDCPGSPFSSGLPPHDFCQHLVHSLQTFFTSIALFFFVCIPRDTHRALLVHYNVPSTWHNAWHMIESQQVLYE